MSTSYEARVPIDDPRRPVLPEYPGPGPRPHPPAVAGRPPLAADYPRLQLQAGIVRHFALTVFVGCVKRTTTRRAWCVTHPTGGPYVQLQAGIVRHFALTAAAFEGAGCWRSGSLGCWALRRRWQTFHLDGRHTALGLAASLPLLLLFWLCLKWPWPPLRRIAGILDEMIVPLFRDCRIEQLAIVALLAGLGEETLFRGVVQAGIEQAVGPSRARGSHCWRPPASSACCTRSRRPTSSWPPGGPLSGLAVAGDRKPPGPDHHPCGL